MQALRGAVDRGGGGLDALAAAAAGADGGRRTAAAGVVINMGLGCEGMGLDLRRGNAIALRRIANFEKERRQMATLEERKKKIEERAAAQLAAIHEEEVRRGEVARLDVKIEEIRLQRANLLDDLQPLIEMRARLVPSRPRAKRE